MYYFQSFKNDWRTTIIYYRAMVHNRNLKCVVKIGLVPYFHPSCHHFSRNLWNTVGDFNNTRLNPDCFTILILVNLIHHCSQLEHFHEFFIAMKSAVIVRCSAIINSKLCSSHRFDILGISESHLSDFISDFYVIILNYPRQDWN